MVKTKISVGVTQVLSISQKTKLKLTPLGWKVPGRAPLRFLSKVLGKSARNTALQCLYYEISLIIYVVTVYKVNTVQHCSVALLQFKHMYFYSASVVF